MPRVLDHELDPVLEKLDKLCFALHFGPHLRRSGKVRTPVHKWYLVS